MKRFALTIAPGAAPGVTITMTRFVPILPTVTTTADERAAYHSVGFDTRMKMGQGQFLTFDQITKREPSEFTDLLRGMRGIRVWSTPYAGMGMSVEGTRGLGSCVTYVVDGVQQHQMMETTPTGQQIPESPDNLIGPSEVGAIEVYTTAERPAGLGGMMETPQEAAQQPQSLSNPTNPGQSGPAGTRTGVVMLNQQCVLVVIWTRARLGLVGAQETSSTKAGNNTMGKEPTRAVTTFAVDSNCSPPAPLDTTSLLVYATVQGSRPEQMSDSAWEDYKYHVLSAIDTSAELPSELFLPSFSLPPDSRHRLSGVAASNRSSEDLVTPSLSTVLAFSLDSSGALKRARIAASSLSDGADTSVLAMVEQAAAVRAFPLLPAGVNSVGLDLVVESAEPTVETHAAVLGQLKVPEWRVSRPARLASGPLPAGLVADSTAPDRVMVMMAVDAKGRVVQGTARLETGTFVPGNASPGSQAQVIKRLPDLQFDPALVGACRVNEFVVESFARPKA
jgi:hypothetical protein